MSARTKQTRTMVVLAVICLLAVAATVALYRLRDMWEGESVPVSAKKGVGTWDFRSVGSGMSKVQVSWYYNWSVDPSRVSRSQKAEFVPMVWNAKTVTDDFLKRAKRSDSKTLLAFNEPDRTDQANMTVQQAIDLWPKLEATGMRLGSPSPAADGALQDGWLDWFMRLAKARNYRIDFITLHWYGGNFNATDVKALHDYVQSVHEKYQLPIWVTEFALMKFDAASPDPKHATYPNGVQQAQFIKDSTTMLEGLDYVERYAWFALPTLTTTSGSGLCQIDGELTPSGKAYRSVGVLQSPAEP
jgi:hypothetical protein